MSNECGYRWHDGIHQHRCAERAFHQGDHVCDFCEQREPKHHSTEPESCPPNGGQGNRK